MQTLNQSLATLYRQRLITFEAAVDISQNEAELRELCGKVERPLGGEDNNSRFGRRATAT